MMNANKKKGDGKLELTAIGNKESDQAVWTS